MQIVLAPIIAITALFLVSCAQDSPVNRATKEKILLMANQGDDENEKGIIIGEW